MKLTLIKEPLKIGNNVTDTCVVKMSMEEVSLEEILPNITNFLRACGFSIEISERLELIKEGE